jgi:GNAT superfamily N-acetyltransferase
MIKLKNILCENAVAAKVQSFENSLRTKYSGIKNIGLYLDNNNSLFLSDLYIKPEFRGQGIGTKIMTDIIKFADGLNLPIVLIPEPDEDNMTQKQLITFYKKFGFVVNSGRKMDYSLSVPFAVSMVRYPKAVTAQA